MTNDKYLKRKIYERSQESFKSNKVNCRRENETAKWNSKDCYPERDIGCYMIRKRSLQEI